MWTCVIKLDSGAKRSGFCLDKRSGYPKRIPGSVLTALQLKTGERDQALSGNFDLIHCFLIVILPVVATNDAVATSKHEDILKVRREIMGDAPMSRLTIMTRLAWLLLIGVIWITPAIAVAGPAEEANAVVDRFSAAYNSNDPEEVVKLYTPDAILLGTVSPVISVGTEAIRKYFSMIKGSGNKNAIQERHTIVLSDNAVVVTGFYEFTRMQDGKPVPGPSRFTMLITKSSGEWHIAHHHSSPHVSPKN
jgi:uncharacterized protein (TIGR02246 family)